MKRIKEFKIDKRSWKESRCLIRHKNNFLELKSSNSLQNEIQHDIILGSMLGDGTITKYVESQNCCFTKAQKSSSIEYIDWTYEFLQPFSMGITDNFRSSKMGIRKNGKITHEKCDRFLQSYSFRTMSHKIFTDLEKKWYKRDQYGNYIYKTVGDNKKIRIKIVPLDIKLTPLSLAIWFCDDGSNDKNGVRFCTDGFLEEEVEFLVAEIRKFGLSAYSYMESGKPRIKIHKCDYLKFINIISPYVIWNCFKYKIDVSRYKPATNLTAEKHSGVKGVNWKKKTNKWQVRIYSNNIRITVGYYSCLNEAILARKNAEVLYKKIK